MARILIIDDDLDMLDSLSLILRSRHHEVSTLSRLEGLEAQVRAVHPDLILLDVMFPDDPQGGFEAARRLRADTDLAHIPVLILSALNARSGLSFGFSEADISDGFMPVAGYLDKPIRPDKLLDQIDALLA